MTDTKGWKELAEEREEKLKEKKEKMHQEEKLKEQKEEKQEQRNTTSKLENAIEEGLKNHPPKIIQAEEKKIEISGDIMTEKIRRLEEQLREGTFKTNSGFDAKA